MNEATKIDAATAVREGHPAQPSGPSTVASLLAREDAALGALVVSAMCCGPMPESFTSLGRIIRAGVKAEGAASLEAALRRRKR